MNNVCASNRMHTWHHSSRSAPSARLADPVERRRGAAAAFRARRGELQALVGTAVAHGVTRAELAASPAFRQTLGAALSADREQRSALALLRL